MAAAKSSPVGATGGTLCWCAARWAAGPAPLLGSMPTDKGGEGTRQDLASLDQL